MKFLHLILRNALRNRLRTFLTAGGTGFLLFVLVFVMTALTEMEAWQGEAATHNRIAVQHSTGLANTLPIELENYLKGEELARHGKYVQKLNWFGGIYQDPRNFFANFAADIDCMLQLWDEFVLAPEQYAKLKAQKNACVVGQSLATKYGWKIGSRIVLQGTIYPCSPELEVVGIFTCRDVRQEEQLFFRWDYFDELLNGRKIVGTYWMKAHTPEDIPKLKELIDSHTKNSSDPTETMTEKEFGQQFMEMMGSVRTLVLLVGTLVMFIMVLMTANTMAMSARERVTEIAVLRTIGFPRLTILVLILAESVLVTTAGAGASLGLSALLFNALKLSPAPQFFPYFFITAKTAAIALACAVGGGLVSALVPAIRSSQRKIVDGLRQVV